MSNDDWTRRRFLETSGAVGIGLGVGLTTTGCPEPDPVDDPYADAITTVSMVGVGANVEDAVRRAIELAGGLDSIEPGQTVFIKPNAVGTVEGAVGFTTSLAVLQAVIRIVKERDPGWIVVGDRSARLFQSTTVFEETGLGAAALAAGADEVYPAPTPTQAPDDYVTLQPPAWEETWEEQGGIVALRKVIEADHLINIPVAKNHRWAGHSLAMKNLMGCVGDDARDPMHYTQDDADRLSRDIVILNQMFAPTLTVIDARTCIVNGGPEGMLADGVVTEPGLILAGADRVALDAVGVALVQEELSRAEVPDPDARYELLTSTAPWAMPQLVHAMDLGIDLAREHAEVRLTMEDVELGAEIEARFRA